MEPWQRPYAYAGERVGVDGPVVGSQHRSGQSSVNARAARREQRSLWMEASLAVAFMSGSAGLSYADFQRQLRARIAADPATQPQLPELPPPPHPPQPPSAWIGLTAPVTPPKAFPPPPPKTPPLQPVPLVPQQPAHPPPGFVYRPPTSKAACCAQSKAPLMVKAGVPAKARPAAVPVKARPAAVPAKVSPAAVATESAESRKRRCTSYLMNKVARTRVEGVAAPSSSMAVEPDIEEFFTPGALLHLLDPVTGNSEQVDEDEDDSWGKDWPSPSGKGN